MAAPIQQVPSAKGSDRPLWPLPDREPQTEFKSSSRFGAPRSGDTERWHVGVDLAATRGELVVAMEDGALLCKKTCEQGWMGDDAKAVLVQHDSGLVVLYGALIPGSYKEFGLGPGSRVKRGQPLARVGTYPAGTSMLHLETYAKGTTANAPWYQGKPPSPEILNPTEYLALAAAVTLAERKGAATGKTTRRSPGLVVAGLTLGTIAVVSYALSLRRESGPETMS